jgi:hypothetical protein
LNDREGSYNSVSVLGLHNIAKGSLTVVFEPAVATVLAKSLVEWSEIVRKLQEFGVLSKMMLQEARDAIIDNCVD